MAFGFSVGSAFLRVLPDATGFGPALTAKLAPQLRTVEGRVGSLGGSIAGTTKGFAAMGAVGQTALAGIGSAAVAGIAKAVTAASNLGESLNKVNVIFEDSSDSVIQFSEDAAKIGLAEGEALDAAAGFGAMAQAAGLAEDKSADMSIQLVQLAADMASFNNQDPSEMLLRLRSGLAGEAEPLRRFGVFLSEARVKQEAYASGIAEVGAELTDAQKIQARYNLIVQDTTKQQGDFARTVGTSLPNQMRVLRAELDNATAAFGKVLLPAVLQVVQAFTEGIDAAQQLVHWLNAIKIAGVGVGDVLINIAKGPATFLTQQNQTLNDVLFEQERITRRALHYAGLRYARELEGLGKAAAAEKEYARITARNLNPLRELELGTNRLADARARAAQEARNELLAENALAGGLLGVASAALSAEEAEQSLRRARHDLADAIKEHGKNSEEAREAQDALQQAIVDSESATLALSTTVNGLVNDVKAGDVTLAEAKTRLREIGRQAGLTKGETDRLIETVQRQIDKYKEVPPKVETHMRVIGANEAYDEVNRVRTALFLLDGSTATVYVRSDRLGVGSGLAAGGVLKAATGFVVDEPTMIRPNIMAGEGNYSTPFGPGAESVQPLNEDYFDKMGQAITRHMPSRPVVVYTQFDHYRYEQAKRRREIALSGGGR